MAQQTGAMVESTFGQGYITEATGLNFPKDAAIEVSNVVFNQDMTVERRLGFDLEDNYSTVNANFVNGVVSSYVWRNVSGIAGKSLTVIQVGNLVKFFDNVSGSPSSAGAYLAFIDLETQKISGAPYAGYGKCQFAEGLGKLFISHPYCDPMYMTYNQDGTMVLSVVTINIRDFAGVDDGITEQHPADLSYTHRYNLFNQGWNPKAPAGTGDKPGPQTQVLTFWKDTTLFFPSNVDYWWANKDAVGQLNNSVIGSTPLGNTPAPKGHFVFPAFYIDRTTVPDPTAGVYTLTGSPADLPIETSLFFRPSVITFFSGRVFYSGVNYNSPKTNYSNRIYFSRIIENNSHIGQCYQDGDPTAENGSDLLPSDGGVIITPEMGTIYKLFPLGYSLIVFASNGIWSISGSTGTGFTAKDYSVAKISSQGLSSDYSFTDFDGSPVWWTKTSINVLSGNGGQDSGASTGVKVQSLTDTTIKKFFLSIPDGSKFYAKGSYNRVTNTIVFLYRSVQAVTVTDAFKYDSALTFNTITKAFSKWTLPLRYVISDIIELEPDSNTSVTKFISQPSSSGYTFTQVRRTDYLDFGLDDYISFVETGYTLAGQAMKKFWVPYTYVYLSNRIPGSLTMYHKWDYSHDGGTGDFSMPQTVTSDSRYDYTTVRRKLRGSGKAVVLRLQGQSGVPFVLTGWAMAVSVNGNP